jgi:hypothetical protein
MSTPRWDRARDLPLLDQQYTNLTSCVLERRWSLTGEQEGTTMDAGIIAFDESRPAWERPPGTPGGAG